MISRSDLRSDLDVLLQEFIMERITGLGGILMRDLESRGGDNYFSQVLACCLYGGIGLDVLKVRKEELPWTLLKYDADKSIHQSVLPVSDMAKRSILHFLVNNTPTASDVVSQTLFLFFFQLGRICREMP